jgi:hypothetical protein
MQNFQLNYTFFYDTPNFFDQNSQFHVFLTLKPIFYSLLPKKHMIFIDKIFFRVKVVSFRNSALFSDTSQISINITKKMIKLRHASYSIKKIL